MIQALFVVVFGWWASPLPPSADSGQQAARTEPQDGIGEAFAGKVRKDCWLKPMPSLEQENPCVLNGDFDGDGKSDEATLVVETAGTKRRGIAVVLGNGKRHLIGAGKKVGRGGDDYGWMNAWRVLPKAEARDWFKSSSGDGLLAEEIGAAGGLIGFVKGQPRWKQWSD